MSDNTDLEGVIRKIKALLAKASSTPSEAEALSFAAKAQELMAKYNIDHNAIDYNLIGQQPKNKKISHEWKRWIAASTARLFNCALILDWFPFQDKKKGDTYEQCWSFIGRKGDMITADLMTDYFIKTVERMANKHQIECKGTPKEWRDFAKACGLRLSQRIFELSQVGSDANQLALIDEHLDKMELKAGKKGRAIKLKGTSSAAGFAAANDIGIFLQAGHDSNGKLKLDQTLALEGK